MACTACDVLCSFLRQPRTWPICLRHDIPAALAAGLHCLAASSLPAPDLRLVVCDVIAALALLAAGNPAERAALVAAADWPEALELLHDLAPGVMTDLAQHVGAISEAAAPASASGAALEGGAEAECPAD